MAINGLIVFLVLGLTCYCTSVRCARILGVFVFAGRSHYILGNSLMRGLATAGHDVAMISPYEEKSPPNNGSYRSVVLTGFADDFQEIFSKLNLFENNAQSVFTPVALLPMMLSVIEKTLVHPNVQSLLYSHEKFDVVIVEQFANDATKVFASLFNAPLIMFNSVPPHFWVNNIVGNPSPPSYIPHPMTTLPQNMNFFQRLTNLLTYMMGHMLDYMILFPKNQAMTRKYFPNGPDLKDVYHSTSLFLLNSHESLSQPVPLVPNMIEIGGYHVTPPKKLPNDLQDYLNNSKEGVVYFSMGSNLQSKDLPLKIRNTFLNVFSKLRQNILWKWEEDDLAGRPSNVKLGKWFPQQDILAHPNVKLFITHGGLLSTTEAVYHGVPILAIPVCADQHSNAQNAVANGFALSLAFKDPNFSEERLSELINELLNNTRYTENVKQRSRLFHDRPLSPMKTAIYWVEYVIRHKGAPHLKVAGAHMPLYRYLLLDVVAFLIVVTILFVLLLGLTVRYFLHRRKYTTISIKIKQI